MVTVLDTIANAPRLRHPEKAHKPDQEVLRKPDWIRVKAPVSKGYAETREIVKSHKLVTVCEEAGCPNIGECWEKKHATFMIMGDTCTYIGNRNRRSIDRMWTSRPDVEQRSHRCLSWNATIFGVKPISECKRTLPFAGFLNLRPIFLAQQNSFIRGEMA